jgi:hypothetical protein
MLSGASFDIFLQRFEDGVPNQSRFGPRVMCCCERSRRDDAHRLIYRQRNRAASQGQSQVPTDLDRSRGWCRCRLWALDRFEFSVDCGDAGFDAETGRAVQGLRRPLGTEAGAGVLGVSEGVDELPFCGTGDRTPLVSGGREFVGEAVWQQEWVRARETLGLPDLHLHDLRHVAATLAAETGAGVKEIMYRIGHSSP